jgi:hypothetical protein
MGMHETNGNGFTHEHGPGVLGGGRLENYLGGATETPKPEVFNDQYGEGYGIIFESGRWQILSLKSEAFRHVLICQALDDKQGFQESAIRNQIAEYRARASRNVRTLHTRSGWSEAGDAVYIDLADARGTVVRVDAANWQVTTESPLYFRRYLHQKPLPLPDANGDLRALTDFMPPLRSDGDRLLLQVWTVLALVPSPRPILMPIGPQGSGKSTLSRVIRHIVDPSVADLLGHDGRGDLPLILTQHAVPVFDNIDSLTGKDADLLCRGVTGGAISRRGLFTNADEFLRTFQGAVILNGLHPPTKREDLLARSLIIELDRLTPEQRRTRGGLDRAFEAARPKLFGGILNALRDTLALLPTIPEEGLSRMADFHRMGRAAAIALGSTSEEFDTAMKAAIARQNRGAADNTLAAAIIMFVRREKRWVGPIAMLLERLIDTAKAHQLNRSSTFWPDTGIGLGKKLGQLEPALAEHGITLTRPRDASKRLTCLEYDATADSHSDSDV